MKIYLETHGCTFNQADSDIMINILKEKHVMVESMDEADVIILNTCYVKLPTEQKMITKIRKIEEKYPDKKLIIAGCMVEVDPIRLSKFSDNASWIGPHKIDLVDEIVERTLNGEVVREYGKTTMLKAGSNIKSNDSLIHILQICEGCSGGCTFCCTKSARGSLNSYPIDKIVEEAKVAVKNGCRELQVTAQDTACYGEDTGESFATLLERLATIDGDFRIRVGMMHPKSLKRQLDDVIDVFKQHEKIYKFIHLPVQTGSPKVLKEMNRLHTLDEFKEMLRLFRKEIPSLSLATDIIVGYPTETDDDFNQTLDLIEEIKPDIIHISKYMHRPTAKSNTLEEIPHEVMKERSHKLNDLKTKVMLENNKKYEGSIQNVLITSTGVSGGYVGYTDSYKNIIIDEAVIGEFMKVEIIEGKRTYLLAKSINMY
ncbi:tRNA (N(6)-L-threonylcarbamoyladenosine(37)-C(2))-methylthiotransferase [Methanosphaera sp. BMS]|uniref:tRNA (N(6)-L-threonylcarbamoyladenosine(37)-C(2))- methylthiotransferase n=1 Tax=Methanosphaera sp. BMS TaxID=1789762 RepID=UPI000DC1C543|nr:tRNA (N(6)-L-threonylcarbamoyladenosine(37)-C(2))-methylthiotransferase [Methanosphaera sp. BMS]AWX32528.1 threonylcarbamoyladenosine tRNA methylthiotransferase [Methanosphaera sp. BMS]